MATLVGCNQSGSPFKIDHTSGTGTSIGPIGFATTNSLARDASGTLYSAPFALITINPQTGAGTFVRDLQPSSPDIRALAFSPANVLFGIRNGGGLGGTTTPDDLVTIDVPSGAVTLVGNTGRAGLQALAFSAGGTLYGWDLGYGLVTINPATAAATLVNPAVVPGSVVDIQSLAFAPDGTLYGASDELYRVDTSNGATTLVGSGGYTDLRGIEFLKESSGGLRIPKIRWAWLWTILIGGILITPIGPICIVCGDPLSDLAVRFLGGITVAVGALGLLNELSPGQR
jgi:hypothetical protein